MCGFVAILQKEPILDVEGASRLVDSLRHRGPDARGEWREGFVHLGHRRLSIIDLATGDQPMASLDGRYVIVFNGEIYNFRELRACLAGRGASFRTRSDTEVVLEAYRRWGAAAVERLHGMFAFLIWDREEKRAFGARDRLGVKPFCWAVHDGALVCASTLEPFALIGPFRRLDLEAARDLMVFDYIPAPRTILESVRKLEPGCRFEFRPGDSEPRIERYWAPPQADPDAAAPEAEELESLLDSAVARQMVSDVPLGVFLSGGIDSSLLVALMSRHSDGPVRTFSVGFEAPEADESGIARRVAERFETDHTCLGLDEIGPESLLGVLGALDEPLADPTIVPTYALARATREHVKVALSGDGADEVFGGYTKYLSSTKGGGWPLADALHRALEALPWRPRGASHLYRRALPAPQRLRYSWAGYGDFPVFRKDLRQLFAAEHAAAARPERYFAAWEARARRYGAALDADVIMRADLETYLTDNCLAKTDRASMLASLEVRVPYLDEIVLERLLPLPAEKKLADGALKALLLPLARRLLPREAWDRPKHGFNVPIDAKLRTTWRGAVETALEWGESNLLLFDYRYLRRLHAINLKEGGVARELWNPFVFLAWSMARSADGLRLAL